jgi:ubiquitin-activating enzyme E1
MMETRRIAGNIIPAMITTTAFVSALSCVEMIKLVQEAPLKKHKNAFINLALPFFAFTVPLPADSMPGLRGRTYTLWDRLFVKESRKTAAAGGMRMKSLLSKIKKLAADEPTGVSVSSISLGPFLLYANFLHEDDEEFLQSTIWETIAEALDDHDESARDEDAGTANNANFSTEDRRFPLIVTVEDLETGEEAELPMVYLERFIEK